MSPMFTSTTLALENALQIAVIHQNPVVYFRCTPDIAHPAHCGHHDPQRCGGGQGTFEAITVAHQDMSVACQ